MSQFRYDNSVRLEKKVLLSDCEGERNDGSELEITGGSVNRLRGARESISDEETTDFGGDMGGTVVDDTCTELLNEVTGAGEI